MTTPAPYTTPDPITFDTATEQYNAAVAYLDMGMTVTAAHRLATICRTMFDLWSKDHAIVTAIDPIAHAVRRGEPFVLEYMEGRDWEALEAAILGRPPRVVGVPGVRGPDGARGPDAPVPDMTLAQVAAAEAAPWAGTDAD